MAKAKASRGHGEKASRKWEQAIAALLAEPTHALAAAAAGISLATLRTWLKLPEFQAEYGRARQRVLEGVVGRLLRDSDTAVTTLNRAMRSGETGPAIRAACAVLDHAVKGVEVLDLANRLAAIEARLDEAAAAPKGGL